MSRRAARLFGWLQGADFYRALHVEAAALMGEGGGRTWLDIGCGPGLLTRLAADAGFAARGVDLDPDKIDLARRLAAREGVEATFDVADFQAIVDAGETFDVVSASSLLVVLSDPSDALGKLPRLVKPGGAMLVIEASESMSRGGSMRMILGWRAGKRGYMLALWAWARSGRALPLSVLARPGLSVTHHPLLGGMVRASLFRTAPGADQLQVPNLG